MSNYDKIGQFDAYLSRGLILVTCYDEWTMFAKIFTLNYQK